MEFSRETRESIENFARVQADKHLSNAEISYFERFGRMTGETRDKIIKKMSKYKLTSDQTKEAREDLAIYMSDYMVDLVEQGHSEKEALELAKTALAADSESDEAANLLDKYENYYLTRDPALDESIGLYYAGFLMLGLAIGAVIGILLGIQVFQDYFWAAAITSVVIGAIAGLACAMLKHASTMGKRVK